MSFLPCHVCHVCGKSYTSKFNLSYHVAHHFDERPFICDLINCSNAYKTKADLKQHQKSHEKALGLQFPCLEIINESKCPEVFDSSTKLNVHKRTFHSTRGGQTWCKQCNREFTNLRSHVKVVHEKSRPFSCDIDGKRFSKLHGLTRHIEAVHLNLAPFVCSQCKKKFKEASALRKHHKSHNRVFTGFKRSRRLQAETLEWGEDEEIETERIRFKCSSCSCLLSSKLSLVQHEAKFHSSASLVCDFCSHRFETKRKILRHIRDEHLMGKSTSFVMNSKAYKCGACSRILSSKKGLDRHKRVVHKRIYDFICEKCSAEFRDRNSLNKHLKRYHGVPIADKSTFVCGTCGKISISAHHLEKHENSCRLKQQKILNTELDLASRQQAEDNKIAFSISWTNQEHFDCDVPIKEEIIEMATDCFDSFESNVKLEVIESDPIDTDIKSESKAIRRGIVEPESKINLRVSSRLQQKYRTSSRRHQASYKAETSSDCDQSDGEPVNVNEAELEQAFKGETFNVFSRSFECKICSNDYEKLQDLKLHFVAVHRIKKIKCTSCNRSFPDQRQFQSHWIQKHRAESSIEPFHLRNYTIPNESAKCLECSKVLSRKESMKRHMELVHSERPMFYCDKCAAVFRDFRTLTFHISKFHEAQIADKTVVRRRKTTQPFKCDDCGETVYGRTALKSHRWTNHLNFKIVNKTRFHCLICQEVLRCRSSAKRHHAQVHQEGKLRFRRCNLCSLSFVLFEDFKKHVDEYHGHENICLTCGISFESVEQIFMHEKSHRSVPDNEKKFSCDLCGWKAQQKVSVEAHMARVHGASKKQFQATCEFCGNSYSCYQSFHNHRKSHMKEANRIKCSYCDRTYHNTRDLRSHEDSHIKPKEKPYRCEIDGCSREYALYRSFRWHVKYSHEQIRNQCKVCLEVLTSREKLISHINELHPELRRFRCNCCGKTFSSQAANVKHMRSCEPTTLL